MQVSGSEGTWAYILITSEVCTGCQFLCMTRLDLQSNQLDWVTVSYRWRWDAAHSPILYGWWGFSCQAVGAWLMDRWRFSPPSHFTDEQITAGKDIATFHKAEISRQHLHQPQRRNWLSCYEWIRPCLKAAAIFLEFMEGTMFQLVVNYTWSNM